MRTLAPRRDHRRLPRSLLLVLALATLGPACATVAPETRDTRIERRAGLYEAYTRARLARHMGDLETAVAAARQAVALAPDDEHVLVTLAELLRLDGEYDEAVRVLTEGLALVDEPAPLLLERATSQELAGEIVDAEVSYQEALAHEPNSLPAVRQYAAFATRVRSRTRALEILETYLARRPEDAEGWRLLGSTRTEAGQLPAALDAYRQAAELQPRVETDYVPMLRLARQTSADALGDAIAEECFQVYRQNVACRVEYIRTLDERTLEADARRARTFEVLQALGRHIGGNLGMLRQVERRLLNELDAERALAFMEGVAADRPRNGQIQARTAWAAYRLGNEDLACRYMARVLEVNPRSPDALNFIGYSYAERGIHLEDAEQLIMRALEVRPNDANIMDSLGWVYYRAGRFAEAVDWLQRAVVSIPDSAVLRDHLADAYRGQGDFHNALKQYVFARSLADEVLRATIQEKIEQLEAALTSWTTEPGP
jgi:tetratricopeptide (TPR) repeat protein